MEKKFTISTSGAFRKDLRLQISVSLSSNPELYYFLVEQASKNGITLAMLVRQMVSHCADDLGHNKTKDSVHNATN